MMSRPQEYQLELLSLGGSSCAAGHGSVSRKLAEHDPLITSRRAVGYSPAGGCKDPGRGSHRLRAVQAEATRALRGAHCRAAGLPACPLQQATSAPVATLQLRMAPSSQPARTHVDWDAAQGLMGLLGLAGGALPHMPLMRCWVGLCLCGQGQRAGGTSLSRQGVCRSAPPGPMCCGREKLLGSGG